MARRRFRVAVLGGTFDRLHAGHRALLNEGLRSADQLGIGLTTDRYLDHASKPMRERIQAYEARHRALMRYLRRTAPARRWWVVPLENGWGRSVEPGIDAIVATDETAAGVASVNAERRRRRLPALSVVSVPVLRGDDGLPVSSRRIRAGTITAAGHRRSPLTIGVGAAPLEIRPQLQAALRSALPRPRIRYLGRASGTTTATNLRSAEATALRRAGRALHGNDYGVGLVELRPRRGRRSTGRAWMLALADADGPVAPAVLVAGDDWPVAMAVLVAGRRSRR